MHNYPLILALSLSLAVGYAGARVVMPPQPGTALEDMIAKHCRAYEARHADLRGAKAAEEFAHDGDCRAALSKHLQ